MSENIQKKLAAVMFTYLVEYDKYFEDNEDYAIKVLNESKTFLKSNVIKYNGKIVKYLDNMSFMYFQSATDAVNCAISIHSDFKKENSQNPDTFQMNLRIGIHMGEVYEKNNDLFGEGVNLAARVQAIAKPGGTVTTQAVYNSIRSEENIFVRDMGRVNLKNIKEPERIFKIYNDEIEYNKETSKELTDKLIRKDVNLVDRKIDVKKELSIGINYIKNLGSPEDDFFCYGITQDLIVEATKVSKIKVPQINQIVKYKDAELELSDLASKLDVDYILDGNIMKMGDNFRLSLELKNIKNNSDVWIETWEGNNDIIQDIKSKVLYKLLDSLNVEIPDHLKKVLDVEKQINPEAYEYFIKAKFLSSTSKNRADLEVVQNLYKKSIELDTNYIDPRYYYAFELFRVNELNKAEDVLKDALIIAKKNKDQPGIAGINIVYGAIYKSWGRYEKAIDYYEEALKIRVDEKNLQDEAKVLNGLAQCFQNLNHSQRAFECYNRSIDIKKNLGDKQGVANSLSNLSMYYKSLCEYGKAISTAKEAVEYFTMVENPLGEFRNKTHLAMYQVIVGYFDDAKANLLQALDFMKAINDYKYIGTVYRYLGLVELNTQNWKTAQEFFIKALEFQKKAEFRPALESTTLFLGLSYFYDEQYDLADKFITKAVQITERRTNAAFYGKTGKLIQLMLKSKMGECNEQDVDDLVKEIEKEVIRGMNIFSERNFNVETSPIKREHWYISQCYLNLGLKEKSEKYKKLAYDDMIIFSECIEDEKIRNDYLTLPLLHRKIRGEDLTSSNKDLQDDSSNTEDVNVFLFCPSCGFNNEKQFKFCPKCGSSLSS
tara:strand:- start:10151 stop:12637 length:2487 start_codon:yes stop_codon:yes gene_type:complete